MNFRRPSKRPRAADFYSQDILSDNDLDSSNNRHNNDSTYFFDRESTEGSMEPIASTSTRIASARPRHDIQASLEFPYQT